MRERAQRLCRGSCSRAIFCPSPRNSIIPAMPATESIYVCLNRGTAGGSLPFDQFVALARDAGFDGCDVDIGYAPSKGVSALRDLFEKGGRKLRYGGWGVPDWRGEPAKAQESLQQLPAMAAAARELNIDHAATWIMPSSDRP